MSLLRTSLGSDLLTQSERSNSADSTWDPMLADENSIPFAEAAPERARSRIQQNTFQTQGKRITCALLPIAHNNVRHDCVLAHFAAALVQGCDVLSPLARGLMQSHYMVASALRGLVQALIMCEAQHVELETESRVSTTVHLFEELDQFIGETFCMDNGEHRIAAMLFLFYAWAIPMAAHGQHSALMKSCVTLCHMCASIVDGTGSTAMPMPQIGYGCDMDAFSRHARSAAIDILWSGDTNHTGPLPRNLAMYTIAAADITDLSISTVLHPRVGSRLDARMRTFLSSPVRAPLPFPPFETRGDEHDGRAPVDFDVSGKAAVREMCHGSPQEFPIALLPPCAARTLWLATPNPHIGLASDNADVWHNDDRYHMATFFQDVGEFPVEEMHRFFEDRLEVAGTAGVQQKRVRHAMVHVRAHANKIEGKRSRGEPPYVTPTCKTMARAGAMNDRRTFRCPFTAESAFTDAREAELRAVLVWQGMGEPDIADVVAEARVGNQAAACLAAFRGTGPKSRATMRRKAFTYPHFFSYFAAFAEKQ